MHVISNTCTVPTIRISPYDQVNFIKINSGPPRYFVLGLIFAILCGDNNTIYTTDENIYHIYTAIARGPEIYRKTKLHKFTDA